MNHDDHSNQEQLRRELMAFAEIGMYRYAMNGTVLQMDRTTLHILELDETYPEPAQVIGKNLADLFEYELDPGALRQQVRSDTEVRRFEYTFRTLTGKLKCCVHDSRLVHDEATGREAVQVITRDITPLKSTQRQLEQANLELATVNEELRSLDTLKNNLLANVSHELRSPLVSVRGYADLIQNGASGPVNEVQQQQLQVIVDNVKRLTAIVDELLDAARLDKQDARLTLTRCDVNGLVEAAVLGIAPRASERGITTATILAPGRPYVSANPGLLTQVLVNLLDNALKFNGADGQVAVRTEVDATHVHISVMDTGIGIADSDLSRIFDRFHQVDSSSTRSYTGLGLGLTLSRDIIERHGGTIKVESRLQKGSTFRVSLPRAETADSP